MSLDKLIKVVFGAVLLLIGLFIVYMVIKLR